MSPRNDKRSHSRVASVSRLNNATDSTCEGVTNTTIVGVDLDKPLKTIDSRDELEKVKGKPRFKRQSMNNLRPSTSKPLFESV